MSSEASSSTSQTTQRGPLKPITHELAFLETFFYSIAQFQFDRAHEFADKERGTPDPSKQLWNGLLNSLITFANAEKSYFAMAFIEKRIFNRTLKPVYTQLSTDLFTLIDAANEVHDSEALALELCKQMKRFTQARLEMIDFYEYFMKCKWSHVRNTKEIITTIQKINTMFTKDFHHPVLDPVKTGFNFETEILNTLLQAELKLCEWEFLESLLTLRECQSKLHAWRLLSPSNSVKEQLLASFTYKSFFMRGAKKQIDTPALYQWLQLFHLHMLSKFSFYFYSTLLHGQAASPDLKGSLTKNSIDYVAKITTFQRKTDAHSISLVLDTTTKEKVYKGHGYFMDNTLVNAPTGINSYPSIVNIPPENVPATAHWPNIIIMLTDRTNDLNATDKIGYLHDTRLESTYFLIKVDVRMYLVLIFKMKKKERDSYIQNFLLEMRANLGHDKLFQMLKPNQSKLFNYQKN
ncbi:KICSTOR subunit 2-like [Clytia hemisphaerica]|uniref:KICSTOR subunit 2-like n=1 Tax=Clytia hemisphaerica TaxID=252671 RepID=UPI0034D73A76|eukprot:TCONS_00007359-protein